MNIVIAIAALAVSFFSARGFFKAGSFKSKASKETLLGAGMGWVEKTPMGVVRLIAWLEILGAIGVADISGTPGVALIECAIAISSALIAIATLAGRTAVSRA